MGAKEERREAQSCVGSYEATWFSHQICFLGVENISEAHEPRVWHRGARATHTASPVVETLAPLSQRHVSASLNQSSAAAEVSAGIPGD